MDINTKTYAVDSSSPNSVIYAGPAHTTSNKDLMKLGRVPTVLNKDGTGIAKARQQFVRSVETNAVTGRKEDLYLTIDATKIPVGTPDASIDTLVDDFCSTTNKANLKLLLKGLKINQ